MTFDNKIHHRKSICLRHYDYSQAGGYFITVCTQDRECLFGDIVDDEMQLNDSGLIIKAIWQEIPSHCPQIELDAFVVMPNHFHGFFYISPSELGAASSAPTVGKIMRRFKSTSAIAVNKLLGRASQPLWQRNYWERVVRDEKELHAMQEYIGNNPLQWHLDKLHP
ncbi:MAG: transposase [Arenimonas sp.]